MKWRIVVPLVVIVAVLAGASFWLYSSGEDDPSTDVAPTTPSTVPGDAPDAGNATPVAGDVTIYAVPSTAGILEALKIGFETANPDATVTIESGSATDSIATAVDADAGVFVAPFSTVSALKTLDRSLGDPLPFGRNLFVIAVPEGNPDDVSGLEVFEADGARTAICGPDSAYGNLAEIVVEDAGFSTEDSTVGTTCGRRSVNRVRTGDLDAALVQRTGTTDAVDTVAIPDDDNVIIDFSMVPLGDDEVTTAWTSFVASAAGQNILEGRGFLP